MKSRLHPSDRQILNQAESDSLRVSIILITFFLILPAKFSSHPEIPELQHMLNQYAEPVLEINVFITAALPFGGL